MKHAKNMPGGIGRRTMSGSDRGDEGAEVASSRSVPGTVTVMGFDRNDVMFRSSDANVVQVRGSNGEISAMLIRIKGDIWGFSRRGDDDWNEMLAIYGSSDK